MPQNVAPGRSGGFLRQSQNFLHSDSQSLLAALEFLEQLASGLRGAALFAQVSQPLPRLELLLVEQGPLLLSRQKLIAQHRLLGRGRFDEPPLCRAITAASGNLLFERPEPLPGAVDGGRQYVPLRLEPARAAAQRRDLPHRFEQQGTVVFDRLVAFGDSIGQLAGCDLGRCQRRPAMLEIAGEFLQVADGLFQLSRNLVDTGRQIDLLLREPQILGFELLPACRLVPHGGFEAGDRLAIFGVAPLGTAEPIFGFGDLAFCGCLMRFAFAGLERHAVDFGGERTSVGVDRRQAGTQLSIIIGG